MNFAIKKEWQYRIEILSGNKWSYVNISNESVAQIYDDKVKLDEAVEKYAKLNISDRQIFGLTNSSNAYRNPTDGSAITREDAMTEQNLVFPAHLSQYNGLALYFISHDFSFNTPREGIVGNKTNAIIKYISNGISLVAKNAIKIKYDKKLDELLSENNYFEQGY